MTEKGRGRGEGHHFAKLTEAEVERIRFLLEQRDKVRKLMEGLTYEKIAHRFDVSKNAIYHISKGSAWKLPGGGVD